MVVGICCSSSSSSSISCSGCYAYMLGSMWTWWGQRAHLVLLLLFLLIFLLFFLFFFFFSSSLLFTSSEIIMYTVVLVSEFFACLVFPYTNAVGNFFLLTIKNSAPVAVALKYRYISHHRCIFSLVHKNAHFFELDELNIKTKNGNLICLVLNCIKSDTWSFLQNW